jgi:uncharacterized membrane protein YidH (DUF202 family)
MSARPSTTENAADDTTDVTRRTRLASERTFLAWWLRPAVASRLPNFS